MENDLFDWLQHWYDSQCNDDWEHSYGIEIQTLDNPGWIVLINLSETELDGREFKEVSIRRDDRNWINCSVRDGKFQGAGGSFNLLEIIKTFRGWVESDFV